MRTTSLSGFVLACLSLAMLAWSSTTQAQTSTQGSDEVGRGLFQAGKAAFDAGNYEDALQYFEQSYAHSGREQLQYNIGLAADRLRRDDKALAAFEAYLANVPDAEKRAEVEARIRVLRNVVANESAAPTPEQTARAADVPMHKDGALVAPAEERADGARSPITRQWWFWTGIGVVVVAGFVSVVALSSGGDRTAAPIEARSGVTIMTLVRQ